VTYAITGKAKTSIKCCECGTESHQEELFLDLSLSFPEKYIQNGKSRQDLDW
jgi:hypothetical protein